MQCTWISFWVQLFLSLIKKWWFRNAPNLAKIIIYEIGLTALKNRLIALLIFIFFYNMSHLKLYNMSNVQCIHPLYGYVKKVNDSYFRSGCIWVHTSCICRVLSSWKFDTLIIMQYLSNTIVMLLTQYLLFRWTNMCIAFNSCYILYIQKFCN